MAGSVDKNNAALDKLQIECRALVNETVSISDFFAAFMGLVGDLAGPSGLDGAPLSIFQSLEAWDSAAGDAKMAAANELKSKVAALMPPADYRQPSVAWLVEYTDDREPETWFQAGAFTTKAEAQKLVDQLSGDSRRGSLRINMIPVHNTIEDWKWDL